MAIDSNILFQAGRPAVQLDDPMNKLAQIGQLQNFQNQNALAQLQLDQAQRANAQAEGLSRLYQTAVKPDGTVDRQALFTGAAQQGLGSVIPGLQKQFADADKATADVDETKAKTAKSKAETLNTALQQGRDILTQANDAASGRQWLIAQYSNPDTAPIFNKLGPMDQALARYDQQTATPEGFARWKQGAMLNANELVKYTTPDANAVLQAKVSRQNNADNVAVARDRLNFDQSQPKGQVITTADGGVVLVDPRRATAEPVVGQDGQQIIGKQPGQLTPKQIADAQGKLQTVQIMRMQLENLKKARSNLGMYSEGRLMGMNPATEAGSNYDAALAALQTTIRQLTRTPGEGAMSDYESRIANAQLPARADFSSSIDQKIDQLDQLANTIETGYTGLLDSAPQKMVKPRPQPNQPAAPKPGNQPSLDAIFGK